MATRMLLFHSRICPMRVFIRRERVCAPGRMRTRRSMSIWARGGLLRKSPRETREISKSAPEHLTN